MRLRACLVLGLLLLAGDVRAQEWFVEDTAVHASGTFGGDAVTVGDVGGDGRTDVIVTAGTIGAAGNFTVNTLGVLSQSTTGDLVLALYPLGLSAPWTSVDLGDLDGDEERDVVVGGPDAVIAHFGGGPVLEPATPLWTQDDFGGNVDVTDRGADGFRDIAVGGRHLLDNLGMRQFDLRDDLLGNGGIDQALCDTDGDGRRDLVVVTPTELRLRRFLASGNFGDVMVFPLGGSTPRAVECGDVDRDGFGDVIVVPDDQTALFVRFGTAGGLGDPVGVDLDRYPLDAAVGGLDGLADEGSGALVVVLASGTLVVLDFDPARTVTAFEVDRLVDPARSRDIVAIGDVNGDRCGDIVVASEDELVGVYYGGGCPDDVEPIDGGLPPAPDGGAYCELDPDGPDADGDGIRDACDLCPSTFDPIQLDHDRDGTGDNCDACPSGDCACACDVAPRRSSSLPVLLIVSGLAALVLLRRLKSGV